MTGTSSAVKHHTGRTVYGIGLKLTSVICFTAMMLLVKQLTQNYPTGQIVFGRSLFGLLPVFMIVLYRGQLSRAFQTERPMGHIMRSIAGCGAMFLWFAALALIALPDATAISFGAPFLVVIMAAVFLGEKIRLYRWSAVVIGFMGILVILWPNLMHEKAALSDHVRLGVICALSSTVLWAGAQIMVRRLVTTETTVSITTYFSLTAAMLALLSAPFGWVLPTMTDSLIFILMGFLGGIGQLLISESFRHADASVLAPFDYLLLVFVSLSAAVFFNEIPGWNIYLGGAIVTSSGLFVLYREHHLNTVKADERQVQQILRR